MPEKLIQSVLKNKIRVKINSNSRKQFFKEISSRQDGIKLAADLLKVSERTVRSWSNGSHMPYLSSIQQLSEKFNIDMPIIEEEIDEVLTKRKAASIGGNVRILKKGNPGTFEGRRRGGIKAIATHKSRSYQKFKLARPINHPMMTPELAELFGIVLGDGSVSKYQITITLNSSTDNLYSVFVANLFEKLFDISPGLYINKKANTISVVASRVLLVKYFGKHGINIGNKLVNDADIPNWIKEKESLTKACLRGLFDTDGCVYVEKHKYKDTTYTNVCVDITSKSPLLLKSIYDSLNKLGLSPNLYSNRSVRIRKRENVDKFFDIVGSSNQKHRERYNKFLEEKGEVPKWS